MSSDNQFYHAVGMSYTEVSRINEKAALDPNSVISQQIKDRLAKLLVSLKEAEDAKVQLGRRRRIVVPYVLENEQIYDLTKTHGQYDIVFKSSERVDAAYSRAVELLNTERLADRIRGKWVNVVVYGISLNALIVSNRTWWHLCVPAGRVDEHAKVIKDDRVMCAIINSSSKKKKVLPMKNKYSSGDLGDMVCTDPLSCRHKAGVALVSLFSTDTNFLQLALFMRAHDVSVLYFSIPACKGMELGYDCEFAELDAYVVTDKDSVTVLYKNATSRAQTYRKANYLSLIAQTHLRLGSFMCYKEFCDLQNGVATYKITVSKHDHQPEDHVYRSWMTPDYRNKYVIQSFELTDDLSDIFDSRSYKPYQFEVDKGPIDDLLEYTMSLETTNITHEIIARKLRSAVNLRVQNGYTMVHGGFDISEKEAMHISLVIYSTCFMRKYVTGQSLKFLTGEDQEVRKLRTMGVLHLIPYTIGVFFQVGIVTPMSKLAGFLRRIYDSWFNRNRVKIPTISAVLGYTAYDQNLKPSIWYKHKGWLKMDPTPWVGFNPYLPGFTEAMYVSKAIVEPDVVPHSLHAYDGELRNALADAMGDCDEASTTMVVSEQVNRGVTVDTDLVRELASKVVRENEGLVDLRVQDLSSTVPFTVKEPYSDAHNGFVVDPLTVLSRVLGRIFPQSTVMITDQVASDIHYSDSNNVAKVVSYSIDSSKLRSARPEVIYRPAMPNHVLPNTKQTLQSTIPTTVKRNANTTSSTDPMDVDMLWDRTWAFMKDAYYLPDVEDRLRSMEYIGPTVETVIVWASRLQEEARASLMSMSFAKDQLELEKNSLMLKGKRKVNLGSSYAQAVKPAQSIQYDRTKARTAVLSPLFAEKVRRDKSVLLPDVFIMQNKSPDDLRKFLLQFDWRTNSKGELRFLELDAEMFDKSQVFTTLAMHWKKGEKFGILPVYSELMEDKTAFRSIKSISAGIKQVITPQRGSGDSDTLDGNSDVSQAAYARFIAKNRASIVFILIMGDDVTIAVRGEVDTSTIENDCMREYNLSVKLTESTFGYFVSGWIVKLPGGVLTWTTDPVKRALSLGDQSLVAETDFYEKHISFADLCKGLEGYAVQKYLSQAIANRYGLALNVPISESDVMDMLKAVVTVASDYTQYRSFFGEDLYTRFL